jgi:hypothetical protein
MQLFVNTFSEKKTPFFHYPITPIPQSSKPIIPFFQHSIIPIAERSGAKFIA